VPLSAGHAKSSDKQRSQVGPGGHRHFPQADHFCRRSSLSSVKAQNCSAYGSIARTGRAKAIVTPLGVDQALALAGHVLDAWLGSRAGARGARRVRARAPGLPASPRARSGIRDGRSGCVTVIQRFGDGLNLNIHFHTLLFDGVFHAPDEGDTLDFRLLPPPTDDEVGVVLERMAARVQQLLKGRGLDASDADLVRADPVVDESPALAGISSASIQGRIALDSHAGARVWRVGDDPDAPWVPSSSSTSSLTLEFCSTNAFTYRTTFRRS
jgi:hypothetical protein